MEDSDEDEGDALGLSFGEVVMELVFEEAIESAKDCVTERSRPDAVAAAMLSPVRIDSLNWKYGGKYAEEQSG